MANYGHGYRPTRPRSRNKFHAVKSGGFDSKKERRRYEELKLMERAGVIHGLKTQVEFELLPTIREPDTIGPKGGVKKGKVIELAAKYTADFTYYDQDGNYIVEDVKSEATRKEKDYVLRRKMMLALKGIRVRET